MNQKRQHWSAIAALGMAVVFTLSWGMHTVHALLAHHDHAHEAVCDAEALCDVDGAHFHPAKPHTEAHCALCTLWHATPLLPAAPSVLTQAPVLLLDVCMTYHAPLACATVDACASRGPPAGV